MATETIAAIATGPAAGAVGMVRLSGPAAFAIAAQLCRQAVPEVRRAGLRQFHDAPGAVIDSGLVLCFAGPNSFTGENIVELQGHGGRMVLNEVLAACVQAGARLARPGEFSERAFLNGRLDLAQAEAIADLINAQSASAVRAAHRTLDGQFSATVNALVQQLTEARVWVEGALDFSDEDVNWLADARLLQRLDALEAALAQTQTAAKQGARLLEGLNVAILGAPNVGKSTLLNALAGFEAAIVSDIAGTTRDLVREHLVLDGLPVTLIDTAGLRHSDDPIETEGMARALKAAHKAELLIYVLDARRGLLAEDLARIAELPDLPLLLLLNKSDLCAQAPSLPELPERIIKVLPLAAKTSQGLRELIAEIKQAAGVAELAEGVFVARARHLAALQQASSHLVAARQRLRDARHPELAAEELRLCQEALGQITGRVGSDALLGEIFSRFCIGK